MPSVSIPTYFTSETYSFAFWRGGIVLYNRKTDRSVIVQASRELNIALGRLRLIDAADVDKIEAMLSSLDKLTALDKYVTCTKMGYVITVHNKPIN